MVRPAISTPYPLPREREAEADDKSHQTNFTRIDWSKERSPVAIMHNDDAPLVLREFQLNDALLSQREFQIDEGGALTHPAKPETPTMHKQPLGSFQLVLNELDAIGADTRPDLAALTKAIRAFGNAQYDQLWMGMATTPTPAAQSAGQEPVKARCIGFDARDDGSYVALLVVPVRELVAPVLYTSPVTGGERDPEWRCFHCGESFAERESAALHFGATEIQSPACTVDIAEYRAMEARMRDYNNEDAELHREIASLRCKHATELRREEEKGYARGLADANARFSERVWR